MKTAKQIIGRTPVLGPLARGIYQKLRGHDANDFEGSASYWENRYRSGGNSGVGSYGFFAEFKAEVLNDFVARHRVGDVIEFGCGDGHQLTLAKYPRYLGFDVSATAVARCRQLFAMDRTREFRLLDQYRNEQADLTLSLDVIFHLVEDAVFEPYMRRLFAASRRHVIIYASDLDANEPGQGNHVRHRKFTKWIQRNLPAWKLAEHIPNRHPYHGDYRAGSFADFYIYEAVS